MLQNDHVFATIDIQCARTRVLCVSPYVSVVAHHVWSKMRCRTRPYHMGRLHNRHSCVHQFVFLTVFHSKSDPNVSTNTFQLLPRYGYDPLHTVDDVSVVLRIFRIGSGASLHGFDASSVHSRFDVSCDSRVFRRVLVRNPMRGSLFHPFPSRSL